MEEFLLKNVKENKMMKMWGNKENRRKDGRRKNK